MLSRFYQTFQKLQYKNLGCCYALFHQHHLRPIKKNGFVVMYKYRGQTTEELATVLCDKLSYSNVKLIEDLDIEDEGLVSYALGFSKLLLPYVHDLNTYKLSIKFTSSENEPVQVLRKDVVKMISNYIGESRQQRIEFLDGADPDSCVVRSYPIQINDISVKQFKASQMDLVLHCLQGCDIRTLLSDMEQSLQTITHQSVHFDSSVYRTRHCGIDEKSPLCVDKDDVSSSIAHATVLPWFVLNDVTMLHHLTVAYIESRRLYYELQEQKEIPIDHGITFYEHWTEETPLVVKPVQKLSVMIITAPAKKLQEVDHYGKRKMSENATSR